jgi:hypothetical protein
MVADGSSGGRGRSSRGRCGCAQRPRLEGGFPVVSNKLGGDAKGRSAQKNKGTNEKAVESTTTACWLLACPHLPGLTPPPWLGLRLHSYGKTKPPLFREMLVKRLLATVEAPSETNPLRVSDCLRGKSTGVLEGDQDAGHSNSTISAHLLCFEADCAIILPGRQ